MLHLLFLCSERADFTEGTTGSWGLVDSHSAVTGYSPTIPRLSCPVTGYTPSETGELPPVTGYTPSVPG